MGHEPCIPTHNHDGDGSKGNLELIGGRYAASASQGFRIRQHKFASLGQLGSVARQVNSPTCVLP
jgi:hypothetical protein